MIANFPAFTLAYFASHGQMDGMTASNVLHNLFFALAGNYIGGGLVMGLGYAWLNQSKSSYVTKKSFIKGGNTMEVLVFPKMKKKRYKWKST